MEKWFNLPRIVRFLIIGCVNAAISYLIYIIAILLLGNEQYQLCVILQWTISSVLSYFNQKFFVFKTKGNFLKEYLKCCSTWGGSYFLNAVFIELLVRYLIKNVFVAQFVSIALVSAVTYCLFKWFAFRNKKSME